jgi:hypothetical protein
VAKGKRFSDNTKVSFFRWWFAGALYYLLAFGSGVGQSDSFLDLLLFLGLGMGIATLFVFNPIVYGMFDIKRNGRIVNQKYNERTLLVGVVQKLLELGKCFLVVLLVALLYQLLNLGIQVMRNLPEGTISIKGEPFLFATFYLGIYNACSFISDRTMSFVYRIFSSRKGRNNES